MKSKQNAMILPLLTLLFFWTASNGLAKEPLSRSGPQQSSRNPGLKKAAADLPPLPTGTIDLNFSEFFVNPVGDRGLLLTEKLRSLDGLRVRILGYMVRQEARVTGKFLLAPLPVDVHEHDSEFADDLPPSTVHVFVQGYSRPVPHTAKPLLLTGILSVGNREEADGRISLVRLTLDALPPAPRTRKTFRNEKGAERLLLPTARENSR